MPQRVADSVNPMISIEYDDRQVQTALKRLAGSGRDMRPAMREIAAALGSEAQHSFQRQRSPEGDPWADLAESTKRARQRICKWPGPVLQVHGRLVGSLTSRYDADSAQTGTNLIYAARQHFGDRDRTQLGRLFLGRNDDLDDVERHLGRCPQESDMK